MKVKIIIASIVILVALIFGAVSFVETNVEYRNFKDAEVSGRKVQVKGEWMRDLPSKFDPEKTQFSFFMKDDDGRVEKIVLEGARPNNFEIADAIVVKGQFGEDYFHAVEILTKCPSKYEGDAESVQKTL